MKIKEIPKFERPRERLKENGVGSLSLEELLAIILKTGTKEKSVKELALDILNQHSTLEALKELTKEQLLNIKGIGEAKAFSIISSIELGKRIFLEKNTNRVSLLNSNDIYSYMKYLLYDKKQEYFYCLYLNNKRELIDRKLLFIGTINRSTVHPREVFKNAYLCSSSYIICIHNHPSGDTRPSNEDIRFTNSLIELGRMNGIYILDHIIIGEDSYYSFYDDNKILM